MRRRIETMLTIFSTPKPFAGHIGVIQRNAIASWKRLHPDVEIILAGDDAGTAEVCAEIGLGHIGHVKRNRYGTKYLASIYEQVEKAARHEILCQANCDIVLMSDFWRAMERVAGEFPAFLMAGRRWDVDVAEPLDFSRGAWESELRQKALAAGKQRPPQWIDYFVFRKGLFRDGIPPFVIGRPGWDNWLLWYPLSIGAPVVDASHAVMAVHQNHDYSYHPAGEKGVWQGEEAQENYRLHEGKYATLADATHVLSTASTGVAASVQCAANAAGAVRIQKNYARYVTQAWRRGEAAFYRAWFALLNATRGPRQRLGLRKNVARR